MRQATLRNRAIHYLLILAVVVVMNFLIPRMLPGSPVRTLIGEDAGSMTAEQKMGILQAYHLTEPLFVQFLFYLRDLFTGNWGVSYSKRLPIAQLLFPAAGWTLLLSGVTMVLSAFFGCLLGAWSARRGAKRRGIGTALFTAVCDAIPTFWIAVLLLAVFSAKLGWFPAYGAYDMWSGATGWARVADVAYHMVLPVAALVLTSLMPYFSTARFGVLQTQTQNYVHMACTRGVPRGRVRTHYILRNGLVGVFTMLMMDIGYLLSGSVLVETVFSYPGLGVLMRDAVAARDYPLIQYTFLISSVLTVAALFAADVCYRKIDPSMGGEDEHA